MASASLRQANPSLLCTQGLFCEAHTPMAYKLQRTPPTAWACTACTKPQCLPSAAGQLSRDMASLAVCAAGTETDIDPTSLKYVRRTELHCVQGKCPLAHSTCLKAILPPSSLANLHSITGKCSVHAATATSVAYHNSSIAAISRSAWTSLTRCQHCQHCQPC